MSGILHCTQGVNAEQPLMLNKPDDFVIVAFLSEENHRLHYLRRPLRGYRISG